MHIGAKAENYNAIEIDTCELDLGQTRNLLLGLSSVFDVLMRTGKPQKQRSLRFWFGLQ